MRPKTTKAMSNLPEIPFEEPDSKKKTCWHLMLNSRFYTHISTILVIMEMDLIIDPDSHVICGFFQKSVCKNTAPVHFVRFLHCCSSSPRLNLSPPIGKPIIKSHMRSYEYINMEPRHSACSPPHLLFLEVSPSNFPLREWGPATTETDGKMFFFIHF